MIGAIYFIVIFIACIIGAVVGLGGGIFIRPIFDAIGYHSAINIQFFASVAIVTMAIVSTIKKMQDGTKIKAEVAIIVSIGAIVGGVFGNLIVEHLISVFPDDTYFQSIQIIATVVVLFLSLVATFNNHLRININSRVFCAVLGVFLGAISTFLGIGGGPINVPIFMIFFDLPVKVATAYSIIVIFFSHFSRLVTMGFTEGYGQFDLLMLIFIIPSAALGGFIGARFSKTFSDELVRKLFVAAISTVILLNIVTGLFIL